MAAAANRSNTDAWRLTLIGDALIGDVLIGDCRRGTSVACVPVAPPAETTDRRLRLRPRFNHRAAEPSGRCAPAMTRTKYSSGGGTVFPREGGRAVSSRCSRGVPLGGRGRDCSSEARVLMRLERDSMCATKAAVWHSGATRSWACMRTSSPPGTC